MIGRYEIRRELGRGGNSTMHLAHDPARQREVAIKQFHFADVDKQRNQAILQRARALSALKHPNILPILDAGEQDGSPYLVFKPVEAQNLTGFIGKEGRVAATLAANIARQFLDALALAQASGIVHGKLKPSNVLIDSAGKIWLTDFDLLPVPAGHDAPKPTQDVHAAGLILLEMLTGHPVAPEASSHGLLIPADACIDPALTAIIEKACKQNPSLRFQNAAEMKLPLDDYLGGAATPIGWSNDDAESQLNSLLDAIILRMKDKADFPALSDSIEAINRLTNSDKEGISRLSTAILKDYGLTNKILRLVNSPIYRTAGGGSISTISRAVMVLGFDVVRNIVITVVLFDHLEDKANARELKEAFLRASLAGALAREASKHLTARGIEESYICALFHNLGQLLAQYYFPEEVVEIRRLMVQRNFSEEQAATHVLGISFSDLGVGIARHWGFPPDILSSLRPLPEGTVRKTSTPDGALRVVASFANELRDAIAANPMESKKKILATVSRRFASVLPLSENQLQHVMEKALIELTELGGVMQVKLKQSPFANHVRGWVTHHAPIEHSTKSAEDIMVAALLDDPSLLASLNQDHAGSPQAVPDNAQAILTAGIQDISNSLVGDFALNDILRITLETMYRAMDFQRVILLIKDARTNSMNGRFSLGLQASEMAKKFHFILSNPVDVFQLAASQGTDIIISNIDDQNISRKIPDWYRQNSTAKTFILFPMNIKGKPAAMIYCDRDKADSIVLPEKELSLLKTLRNQALLAIKQTI